MDELKLIIDLHRDGPRQGPGSDSMTCKALEATGVHRDRDLRVLDIGCGTGASTLCLAEALQAKIVAVDLFPEFLESLVINSQQRHLGNDIQPLVASMDHLPFGDESFDIVWSEGAVYNIGFEYGLKLWRRLLREGGVIVVSEITWLTDERPQRIQEHWEAEYPGVATADEKINQMESLGYDIIDRFTISETAWIEAYYKPLLSRLDAFCARHNHAPEVLQIAQVERAEASLYDVYKEWFGYCFYVGRKRTM